MLIVLEQRPRFIRSAIHLFPPRRRESLQSIASLRKVRHRASLTPVLSAKACSRQPPNNVAMSFDQLASLEAGTSSGQSPAYSDDPEFQNQSRDLMNKLFKLTGNNQRLRGEIAHLGTKRDTPRVRERVHSLLDESRDLFREVGDGLKTLQKTENATVGADQPRP
jgi:hypothetical protein